MLARVGHWSPARWLRPSGVEDQTRADCLHALVQELADLAARAAGEPTRPVPRLENDLALPDQLKVMVGDLMALPPTGDVANDPRRDATALILAALPLL